MNPMTHIDCVNDLRYNYEYDSIGRLIRQELRDSENATHLGATNIPTIYVIMSPEFQLHAVAYALGFEAAIITDLNLEETPWTMFRRAIGW